MCPTCLKNVQLLLRSPPIASGTMSNLSNLSNHFSINNTCKSDDVYMLRWVEMLGQVGHFSILLSIRKLDASWTGLDTDAIGEKQ